MAPFESLRLSLIKFFFSRRFLRYRKLSAGVCILPLFVDWRRMYENDRTLFDEKRRLKASKEMWKLAEFNDCMTVEDWDIHMSDVLKRHPR